MSMKIVLIPLALLVFVFIYPFAEYSIDCPIGIDDPKGNEDCTWTKMMFWEAVEVLSLTDLGFPPDRVFFVEENNPDAYHNHSFIPLVVATAVTICLVKVREHERGYDMKRRQLDDGYWFVLQKRLLDSGFITVTINPGNGKNYWEPTLKGIKAYKTVLELTKRNRLFKGPKFTDKEIDEFRYTDKSSYEKAKNWLIEWNMIKPVYDPYLPNDERYELTEYAYEFFQTYSTTITKGAVNPGPHVLRHMGEAVLMAIFIVCYVIIKTLTRRVPDKKQMRRRN